MSLKSMLFNTDMVRALLEGRKTVTRRVINPRYRDDESGFQVITTLSGEFVRVEKVDEDECGFFPDGTERYVNPPCKSGDVLWVREAWTKLPVTPGDHFRPRGVYYYRADEDLRPERFRSNGWRPSIHMSKEAARLFLRVTGVRAERLQEITKSDALREGVRPRWSAGGCRCVSYVEGCMGEPCPNRDAYEYWCHVEPFVKLWDSTIKPADLSLYGWEANPWVWVIEFEQVSKEAALGGGGDG